MTNLTVDQLHTYYVLAGSTPILVHNADGESGSISPGDLNGEQLANYNRYVKKLRAAAGKTVITRTASGGVQFDTQVPGRVPGSYAQYTKTVGANGKTIGHTKATILPDGSVAHVKDKFTLPGETC